MSSDHRPSPEEEKEAGDRRRAAPPARARRMLRPGCLHRVGRHRATLCSTLTGGQEPTMAENLAMVTGASSGIGEAFARELARRGYSLILVARRRERLDALAAELAPVAADAIAADLGTEEGVERVMRRLHLGGVSLLVNNAGLGYRGKVAEQPDANIARLVRVNLEAPMRLSRAALTPMIAMGRGTIVNVASMGAFQPVPYLNVYAATKAGLLSFTEALADEIAGTGVRVQALCPGNIPTGFQEVAGTKGSRFDRTPSMSASEVARRSLAAALDGGGTLQVPAALDRVSVFAQRFLPRSVARRVASNLLKPD